VYFRLIRPHRRRSKKARARRLEESLIAPCCWKEPLAQHLSPAAQEMKAEVAQWILEGRTDREIVDAYKAQYGERILTEPEGGRWWWVNVIPWVTWVMLLFGGWVVCWYIRRMLRAPAAGGA
jgi:cytochrome c-type biogenesis protein CcmH/NrfF